MRILLTGGAGYIGSHTCLDLLAAGHSAVIYDNFANSDPQVVERIQTLAGLRGQGSHQTASRLKLVIGDILDTMRLTEALTTNRIEAVIHFAGLKSVGESTQDPLRYYTQNVMGSVSVLKAIKAAKVRWILFSSSATVYGTPKWLPYTEDHPKNPESPYGRSKLMVEQMLLDYQKAQEGVKVAILRYFNPVGAHPSGEIGESPKGVPNNLMPFMAQVAVGRLQTLRIFGSDYPTADGTGVRDYLHVMDLARGHLLALERLEELGTVIVNLGTGRGYSVLEVVRTFEEVSGRKIPREFAPRRPGDLPSYHADPRRARELLGFEAQYGLTEMVRDHWRWQKQNRDPWDQLVPGLPQPG